MHAIYSIDEIKTKLEPIFKTEPIYKAVLFGSYAKGCATENSDVDIAIDSRGHLENWGLYGVLHDISETLVKSVDLLEMSQIRFNTSLLYEIEEKGVLLYERQ